MANLSNIIKISQANYNTLSTQGSVTIGGVTYTYDSNALYVIEETGQVVPVSGTNDGTNWTTITIDGTTKNIPSGGGGGSGTVTSVSAGTGLSISGTPTVNPTVNIDFRYKLPTTSEWNTVSTGKRETFRNYTVSPSTPYFYLYDGSGNLIETIGNDISEAYDSNSPNWDVLFEYFRQQVFKLGAYDMTGLPLWGPYAAAGLFTASDDGKNSFEIGSPSIWMSTNLLSYFTAGDAITSTDIDSYKVEIIGPARSAAECTLKITVFTIDANEYVLQICSRWVDSSDLNVEYITDGWHGTGTVTRVSTGTGLSINGVASINPIINVDSNYKLQTNTEWQNTSLYNAISGFSTSNGCATSGFYKSTLWSLTDIANITEPYDGMKVVIRIPLTGVSTGGTLLSIDGGTTYHPVAYNKDTVLTTHYAINSNKVFIYNSSQTMSGYLTMNVLDSKPSDWSTNYNKYYRKAKSATKSYDWILNTSTTWDKGTYDYAKGGTATSFTGVWQGEANYYSDANSIGYQLRTNSALWANKTYNGSTGVSMNRYTLLFEVEGGLSGAATTIGTGTSKVTIPFKYIPGGVIKYYTTSGAITVNTNFTATGLWDQYAIDLRYTFNIGTAVLTANKPVYIRMSVNSDGTLSPVYSGSPSHPIVTDLPTSEDNYVYLYLGVAYSTSSIELYNNHPIYYYKNGHIQLWSGSLIPDASFLYDMDEGDYITTITAAQYNLLAAANAFDVTDDGNTTYRFYRSVDDKGATNNPLHFVTHRIFNRVEELIITDNYNVTHTSSQIMQSYNASSPYIVRKLTQAQYNALATKDSYTIYIIVG